MEKNPGIKKGRSSSTEQEDPRRFKSIGERVEGMQNFPNLIFFFESF